VAWVERVLDSAILVEQMYKVDCSLSLTIFGTGLGLSSLLLSGNKELHEGALNPFLSGQGEPLADLVHLERTGTTNYLERGGKDCKLLRGKMGMIGLSMEKRYVFGRFWQNY
jgi:hypothetical protein